MCAKLRFHRALRDCGEVGPEGLEPRGCVPASNCWAGGMCLVGSTQFLWSPASSTVGVITPSIPTSQHLQYLYTVTGPRPDARHKTDPVQTGQVLLGRGVNTDPGRREIAASGAVSAQLHRSPEQPRLIFASLWKQYTRGWSQQRRKQHREREKERERWRPHSAGAPGSSHTWRKPCFLAFPIRWVNKLPWQSWNEFPSIWYLKCSYSMHFGCFHPFKIIMIINIKCTLLRKKYLKLKF